MNGLYFKRVIHKVYGLFTPSPPARRSTNSIDAVPTHEAGQWAGLLDLYGKEDVPALHESPRYE